MNSLTDLPNAESAPAARLEQALFEAKRILVGQDQMVEQLSVYQDIESRVSTVVEERELTMLFVSAALLFLLLAAGAAFTWTGRFLYATELRALRLPATAGDGHRWEPFRVPVLMVELPDDRSSTGRVRNLGARSQQPSSDRGPDGALDRRVRTRPSAAVRVGLPCRLSGDRARRRGRGRRSASVRIGRLAGTLGSPR